LHFGPASPRPRFTTRKIGRGRAHEDGRAHRTVVAGCYTDYLYDDSESFATSYDFSLHPGRGSRPRARAVAAGGRGRGSRRVQPIAGPGGARTSRRLPLNAVGRSRARRPGWQARQRRRWDRRDGDRRADARGVRKHAETNGGDGGGEARADDDAAAQGRSTRACCVLVPSATYCGLRTTQAPAETAHKRFFRAPPSTGAAPGRPVSPWSGRVSS